MVKIGVAGSRRAGMRLDNRLCAIHRKRGGALAHMKTKGFPSWKRLTHRGCALVGLAALVAACDAPPQPGAQQGTTAASAKPAASAVAKAPAQKPSGVAESPSVPKHMAEHFTRGAKMRDAVVAGDLAALKKDAQWMAEHELTGELPATWKPKVMEMQDAAKRALDATNIEGAAAAVAAVAAACGSCHTALGGPKVAVGEPPAGGSGAAPHMQRHQWAAARLWDGLSGPSADAWVKGAEAMADAPLTPEALAGQQSVPKEVDTLAKDAHAIAENARGLKDPAASGPVVSERVTAYGKLLQTCASCHQMLKQGPKATK
jgi:cytochrome c2